MNVAQKAPLGESLRSTFQTPAFFMGNYYWVIHTRMYPSDFAQTALNAREYLDTTKQLAKLDAEAWARAPRREIGKLLTQQLCSVMQETVAVTGAPKNLEKSIHTGRTSQVKLGLDVVRSMAVEDMRKEGYTAANPLLEDIASPFEDTDTFIYFYELQNTRLHAGIKLLPLNILVPGIDTSRL